MNIDNLSGMPDWNDERFRPDEEEEGDAWKRQIKNQKAAQLYNQWKSVLVLLLGLYDSVKIPDDVPEKDFLENEKEIILGDAYLVGAKIRGAEGGDLYTLRMENAGIIRKAAQAVYMNMSSIRMLGLADDRHIDAVRSEIEKFRQYFKEWVASFEKDEFEDEWGLYI